MGLCSSSTSHDTTTMGSTFTSMEDDNKHNPNSSTSSTATNKNRSARYNNSSHHDNPDPSPSSSSTSSSTSYASIHQEPINDILVGRTTTEEIFTCSDDNTVCLLNTATTGTAQVVHRWSEHNRPINQMAYGPRSEALWTCSRDLTMKMWRRGNENSLQTIEDGHELNITAICLNSTESLLCSGSRDTSVCLWDVATGTKVFRKKTSRNLVTCMQWMNENTVVQGSEDLKLRTWDCRDRTVEAAATMTGYVYFPLCIDVIDDGGLYVCTGSKGFDGVGCEVRLWDMRTTKQCVSIVSGHRQSVVGCRFLGRNKNSIVSVSKDQTLKVWDIASERIVLNELGHTGSQFTCVDVGGGGGGDRCTVYGGAASGYSKYVYDNEDSTIAHVHTHSTNNE